ncbi:MAG: dTDP-4-dehydrorhamnose 3,5-epimerase family protein [Candidatus Saccharibacteria bacterium]|nr:dTDP-4-dehydrorhamnose 3,5-epimerase family protein [Microbacteriaceae bacterium]
MEIRELSIAGSYEVTPVQRADDRGVFLEWYRHDLLAEVVGHALNLRQANTSVSKRGVVRGIHFADIPMGQAKYVTANRGAVLDFVVDIRTGSPTFGEWDSVLLDDVSRKAIYIGEGLGHAFVSLTDNATVSYLVSDTYSAPREHGINPTDPAIGLVFPAEAGELLLSPKDADAPSLAEAAGLGLLPDWTHVRDFYSSLDQKAT